MFLRSRWALALALAACLGTLAQSPRPAAWARSSSPDPKVFRIPARDFPWYTKELLSARVEDDNRADGDGLLIYNRTIYGDPTWTALKRVTGWYESALMWKNRMNPGVDMLVSEYATVADAEQAYRYENHAESYRNPRSHPKLGSESVEYASSVLANVLGSSARVEDCVIHVRYQNVELDVAVYDEHDPRFHWEKQYRRVALTLARRLVAIAQGALPLLPPSPAPTSAPPPTATVTAAQP